MQSPASIAIADLMTKEGLILVGVLAIPSTISPVDYTSMIRSFDADIESMRILRLAHVLTARLISEATRLQEHT